MTDKAGPVESSSSDHSSDNVNWADPYWQAMPFSVASLEFLRHLTPHYESLSRRLTESEWTAWRQLAKVGAVDGITQFSIGYTDADVPSGKLSLPLEKPGVHYFRVGGDYLRAPETSCFPENATVDLQLIQARLTSRGEHWKSILSGETQDPLLVRSVILSLLHKSKSHPGVNSRVPAPSAVPVSSLFQSSAPATNRQAEARQQHLAETIPQELDSELELEAALETIRAEVTQSKLSLVQYFESVRPTDEQIARSNAWHTKKQLLEKLLHERHVARLARFGWKLGQFISADDPHFEKLRAVDEEAKMETEAMNRVLGVGDTSASVAEDAPRSERSAPPRPSNAAESAVRNKVFISYSHKDKQFLNELLTHLRPLERAGRLSIWSDVQIRPGSKWLDEIETALRSTEVAVMLVSKDFLASDFIHENEFGPLLNDAIKSGVKIIWVLVRACLYKHSPLVDYQAAIPPDKSLAEMKAERDRAWVTVCEAITNVATKN